MRKFVLVTATQDRIGISQSSAGICKLKRGIKIEQFISEYLLKLGIAGDVLQRGNTCTVIKKQDEICFTWGFTEYPESELLHAVSHLTREELLRDLKELLPLRNIVK